MNFSLFVIGFPHVEFRFKGVDRDEVALHIVKMIVHRLSSDAGVGDPCDYNSSEEAFQFWCMFSEKPYFVSDGDNQCSPREIDEHITVSQAFAELDTGVIAGESGWIGFHGVWQCLDISTAAAVVQIKQRDLALLKTREIGSLVATKIGVPLEDVKLCDPRSTKPIEDNEPVFRWAEAGGRIALDVHVVEPLTVFVTISSLDSLVKEATRGSYTLRNCGRSTSLAALQKEVEERSSSLGLGFVDWEEYSDASNVPLLHPDTQLYDLVDESTQELHLTWIESSHQHEASPTTHVQRSSVSAADRETPVVRVALYWEEKSVDVRFSSSPFSVAQLVSILRDQKHLTSDGPCNVWQGHTRLSDSTDLWKLVPRGMSPLILLTVE